MFLVLGEVLHFWYCYHMARLQYKNDLWYFGTMGEVVCWNWDSANYQGWLEETYSWLIPLANTADPLTPKTRSKGLDTKPGHKELYDQLQASLKDKLEMSALEISYSPN